MAPHLISPPPQAGEGLLLSQGLQHSVHSLGPLPIRVQVATQRHSATVRGSEHLRVPTQQRSYVRRNPANLCPVYLKPAAGSAAGACGDTEEEEGYWVKECPTASHCHCSTW